MWIFHTYILVVKRLRDHSSLQNSTLVNYILWFSMNKCSRFFWYFKLIQYNVSCQVVSSGGGGWEWMGCICDSGIKRILLDMFRGNSGCISIWIIRYNITSVRRSRRGKRVAYFIQNVSVLARIRLKIKGYLWGC